MSNIRPFIGLLLFLVSAAVSAQEGYFWEQAFARPHGAILVSEIMHKPQKFLVQNKGKKIKIAGKFYNPNLSSDGSKTRAGIVWGGRYSGVACVSTNSQEILKVVDLLEGSEVLATGTVSKLYKGWLYLNECTIEEGVTLFHSRDPKFILGSWCGVYKGKTFRKFVFTRGKKGQYLQAKYEPTASGGWAAWSAAAQATRVKRTSARRIETAFIGPKYDYSRNRFNIVSHNQMSDNDGASFYRCQ